jgi:hypothetical protein
MKKMTASLRPGKIEYNGETSLGIPTGITGKSFSLTKISRMKQNPGWIVRGELISEWKITGFCTIEDGIYLYGPAIEGISLEELLEKSLEEFLPSFHDIINALLILKSKSIPLFTISTHSIFILKDGGILFLPPDIFKELIDLRSSVDKREVYTMLNHPDRNSEENLSFALGVLLYKTITGVFPFPGEKDEEIHNMMRELAITSPRLIRPGLKDDAVEILESSLQKGNMEIPGLEVWENHVRRWKEKGIEEEITEEEIRVRKENEEQKKKRATQSFQFKVFWHQNFVKIAVITGIVLFLGSIVGFTIKNMFFRARKTAGMSPEEITLAYYESINNLDYFTIDDCLLGDAGKDEARTVMNLYVITRQRSVYEPDTAFISAKEWDARGRPELKPFLPMYGVTNLKILEQTHKPGPVITVSYQKWSTETEEIDTELMVGTVIYYGFFIKERLYFKQDRGDWVIYRIEVLEKRKIS